MNTKLAFNHTHFRDQRHIARAALYMGFQISAMAVSFVIICSRAANNWTKEPRRGILHHGHSDKIDYIATTHSVMLLQLNKQLTHINFLYIVWISSHTSGDRCHRWGQYEIRFSHLVYEQIFVCQAQNRLRQAHKLPRLAHSDTYLYAHLYTTTQACSCTLLRPWVVLCIYCDNLLLCVLYSLCLSAPVRVLTAACCEWQLINRWRTLIGWRVECLYCRCACWRLAAHLCLCLQRGISAVVPCSGNF